VSPPLVRRVPVPYGTGDRSVSQTILPGELNSKCARRFRIFDFAPSLRGRGRQRRRWRIYAVALRSRRQRMRPVGTLNEPVAARLPSSGRLIQGRVSAIAHSPEQGRGKPPRTHAVTEMRKHPESAVDMTRVPIMFRSNPSGTRILEISAFATIPPHGSGWPVDAIY
jgi:hypothetical protein